MNVRKRTSPNRKKQKTLTQEYYTPFETSESSSIDGSTLGDKGSPSNVPNGDSVPNGATILDASPNGGSTPNGASELVGNPNGDSYPNGSTVIDASPNGGSTPNGASEFGGVSNGCSTPNGATELSVFPNGASFPNRATELGGDQNEGSTRNTNDVSEIGGGPNGVEGVESSSLWKRKRRNSSESKLKMKK